MELEYKKKNVYAEKREIISEIMDYATPYKRFLDESKTERMAVKTAVKMAKEKGYTPFSFTDTLKTGDKVYFNNKNKSLALIRVGSEDIERSGIKILVAHIDSPRLDLKQVPLYEESDVAYLKTHYYGGIKKYQWLTVPLALHGIAVLTDGKTVEVDIGENEDDPVFFITDLLPHLSQEIDQKTVSKAFPAENLNVVFGGIPIEDKKNGVKLGVLKLLNDRYSITEEDFLSAELELVPAYKAKDVGLDRAFIASYGHDDKVCAYTELTALLDSETDSTVAVFLHDKEEIGREGVSGAQSKFVSDILETVVSSKGANSAQVRSVSVCLSADVNSAYDPNYKESFEKNNSSALSYGVAMSKYTGARGKSGASDASAELVGYFRKIFKENGVCWQTGELGKVDLGGGGTVAKYFANLNIDTVDIGVPVASMHAPYELISKADLYSAYCAFCAFIKATK